MKIKFYDCTADKKRVNKEPFMTEKITLNSFEPINAVDIITPEFTLEYNSTIPLTYNYCYIDDLKRFYYILTMSQEPGNLIRVKCYEDIRMSKINGNDFIVTVMRNQFKDKSPVIDKSLPINPYYHEPEVIIIDKSLFVQTGGYPRFYDIMETI